MNLYVLLILGVLTGFISIGIFLRWLQWQQHRPEISFHNISLYYYPEAHYMPGNARAFGAISQVLTEEFGAKKAGELKKRLRVGVLHKKYIIKTDSGIVGEGFADSGFIVRTFLPFTPKYYAVIIRQLWYKWESDVYNHMGATDLFHQYFQHVLPLQLGENEGQVYETDPDGKHIIDSKGNRIVEHPWEKGQELEDKAKNIYRLSQ